MAGGKVELSGKHRFPCSTVMASMLDQIGATSGAPVNASATVARNRILSKL
jgi:hypothetical protein